MKKLNAPLIIGGIIVIMILVIMLYPQLFTDKNPYDVQRMQFSYEDGEHVVERAPYPPSAAYPMGSDDLGRDIWAYIVYGTGLTIVMGVLVALGRFIIAVPLGLLAGFGHRAARFFIKALGILFSAVPAVLISMIVLSQEPFMALDRAASVTAFVLVLALVGWPKLSSLITERVEEINAQPYIRGEVAIGKSRLKIALENVFPHLVPELIVLYFMEVARVLVMIMTLGIFNVFIGNLRYLGDADWGRLTFVNVSFEPEWASMLSTSRGMLGVAPWAVLFPALAFFISVLGFNLAGEGLRGVMQKKDSRIVPTMRKFVTLDFAGVWKGYTKASKIRVVVIAVLVLAAVLIPHFSTQAAYRLAPGAHHQPPEERVIVGTEPAQNTADYIVSQMERLGIKPVAEDYCIPYNIPAANVPAEYTFEIPGQAPPVWNEDYTFIAAGSFTRAGRVVDATRDDLFNISDYSKYEDAFVLIDPSYYEDEAVDYIIRDIRTHTGIKGVLCIARLGEEMSSIFAQVDEEIFILRVTRTLGETLAQPGSEITVSAVMTPQQPVGRNILGVYGKLPEESEEIVMIGMNYNHVQPQGRQVLQFNLDLMEKLVASQAAGETTMFLFVDGTQDERYHGMYAFSDGFPVESVRIKAYIDLTGLQTPRFDELMFSVLHAPTTRQYAWGFGHYMTEQLGWRGIEYQDFETEEIGGDFYYTNYPAHNVMYWDRGIAAVIIRANETGEGQHGVYEIGRMLIETFDKNNY